MTRNAPLTKDTILNVQIVEYAIPTYSCMILQSAKILYTLYPKHPDNLN